MWQLIKRVLGSFDIRDFRALAGVGLMAWGLWQVYPPAAFVVTGSLLLAVELAGALTKRSR